jgi:quercetin dioxygenase-like cupin family protein
MAQATAATAARPDLGFSAMTRMPQVPQADPATVHIGADDLPYVDFGGGVELQVLQIDLNQGLWVVRARFQPGTVVQPHYHTGPVLAVTLQGRWFYKESPEQVNSPGSYLFEPASSIHTLTIPEDQDGPTIAWFAVYGPNVNLDADGKVDTIMDAGTLLEIYRAECRASGRACDGVIVVG